MTRAIAALLYEAAVVADSRACSRPGYVDEWLDARLALLEVATRG